MPASSGRGSLCGSEAAIRGSGYEGCQRRWLTFRSQAVGAVGVTAVAHQLSRTSGIATVSTAVLFTVRNGAVAGRVRALLDLVSHNISSRGRLCTQGDRDAKERYQRFDDEQLGLRLRNGDDCNG